MRNIKKVVALALAATMVMGSSLTAFAADDPHSSTGAASNEGHVDKHVVKVTLPTVAEGSTPFNYTIDPERLVNETSGSRYGTTTFTDDAKRDGVYFLKGIAATLATYEVVADTSGTPDADTQYYTESEGTYTPATKPLTAFNSEVTYYTQTSAGTAASSQYDNKSGELTATSESSADIELTVKVEVGEDGNVTLADAAPSTDGYTAVTVADADAFAEGTFYTKSGSTYTKATTYDSGASYYKESDAELYLALMVGSEAAEVLEAGKTATKTVTIAGIDSNFETVYNSTTEKYEYAVKANPSAWNTSSFYLTGVASKASAENVNAPTLKVTWSFADPAAEEEPAEPNEPAEPDEFTVTFNTNGGSDVDAQTVEDGGKATEPAENPTKEADDEYTYAFAGWYADSEFEEEFNFDTAITEDTTIYAKWTATAIGPVVTLSNKGVVTVRGLTSEKNYAEISLTGSDGLTLDNATCVRDMSFDVGEEGSYTWTAEDGGYFTMTMPSGYLEYWDGVSVTVSVKLSDGSTIRSSSVELEKD